MVPRFPVALLLFALVNVALASFLVPAAKPELTLADVNLTPRILEEGKPASCGWPVPFWPAPECQM